MEMNLYRTYRRRSSSTSSLWLPRRRRVIVCHLFVQSTSGVIPLKSQHNTAQQAPEASRTHTCLGNLQFNSTKSPQ
ncbi:hypothetical protein RIF29_18438 [Crotalaria pallida]|uniref:Uncharacterized protein n=1 Tax=Crotalaria pallida TaxID=3830 RepID=A0AAN9FIU5_CROPI